MGSRGSQGSKPPTFEAIRSQLLDATPALDSDQILDLADLLHDVIRSRRASGAGRHRLGRVAEPERSWAVFPDA